MLERTFVLIKPDAVERNVIGNILSEYERNGLKIVKMKMIEATESIAKKHYAAHIEKSFFSELLAYITSGPLVALILEGEDAITRVRTLNGATNPEKATDNTIRALYGIDKSRNTVHASDSQESAEKEIALWFD
ncbi:nucleoside-diphosphate kinase [Lacticigenium naphthae]|uniref:nucleoside-diphosphate kinase n=1 Tax=Lacticigenium naphthae TaxID=515351 RepID=UPI00041122B2|nr:nucleoside-diphosphate kinase [Lacticigenium naphthae]